MSTLIIRQDPRQEACLQASWTPEVHGLFTALVQSTPSRWWMGNRYNLSATFNAEEFRTFINAGVVEQVTFDLWYWKRGSFRPNLIVGELVDPDDSTTKGLINVFANLEHDEKPDVLESALVTLTDHCPVHVTWPMFFFGTTDEVTAAMVEQSREFGPYDLFKPHFDKLEAERVAAES